MSNSEDIFNTGEAPVRKKSRIGRVVSWGFILALGGAVGLEGLASYCQRASVERLKALIAAREGGPRPTVDDVQTAVAGWTFRTQTTERNSKMYLLKWPSLFRSYMARVVVNDQDGVTRLDMASAVDDDVTNPIAMDGEHGLQLSAVVDSPVAAPQAHSAPSSKAVAEQIREAFAKPREAMRTGVLIFPVVDSDNRIRSDGAALGTIASYSAICSPRKRMAIDPRHVRSVLLAADCWRVGKMLDQRLIDECAQAVGTPLYAVARLETAETRLHLTVECRGGGEARPDRTFEHDLAQDELTKVPGVIALDVQDYLLLDLPLEDRRWVATPQIRPAEDAVALSEETWNVVHHDMQASKRLEALVKRNPECVAAWDVLFAPWESGPKSVLRPSSPDSKVLACSSIRRALALSAEAGAAPLTRLAKLLELAPDQRGEAPYHRALVEAARSPADHELLSRLLALWEQDAVDYPNLVARGEFLMEWAWAARGNKTADKVTAEGGRLFVERLEQARRNFEQAAQNGPGWIAHRELVSVAMGLGLPFDYMQHHFLAAARLMPGDKEIYRHKFVYLQKKWYGAPETLLAFGREALDSGQWDSEIPQTVPRILSEAASEEINEATDYRQCKLPEFWNLLQDYCEQVQQHSDKAAQKLALNVLALYGTASGHFTEAAAAFQRLDIEPVQPRDPVTGQPVGQFVWPEYDAKVFGWRFHRYAHWRDRALANADQTSAGRLAAARVALADGRLDDAEQAIDAAMPADDGESAERERCRRALALGRKLARDGKLEVSAQEAFETLVEFQRTSCRGLDRSEGWTVDGDELSWEYPGSGFTYQGTKTNAVFFPVGVRHALISFTMNQAGGLICEVTMHSQAVRDHVVIQYSFNQGLAMLMAQDNAVNHYLRQERVGTGPWPFACEYGSGVDQIVPSTGVRWDKIVYDDVPSTFGFVLFPQQPKQRFSISNLKIELRN